jgi:hypothetical protein
MQVGQDVKTSAYCKSQLQFQQTNNYQLLYLTSSTYFNQQRLWADGILIPNLHKALAVGRNLNELTMNKEINDQNLETTIEKLSQKSGLTIASARNLLTFNNDYYLAEKLGVKPADISCIFSGEASLSVADKYDLTYAELQNLIDELGKEFVVGMLFATLLHKEN